MSNGGGSAEVPLVGLVGPAGAGKDSLAGLLVANHGFAQLAFAEKLRAFVRNIDPAWAIAEKCLGGYEPAKRNVPGFRERLIEIGDSAREHISPEIWIDAIDEDVERLRTGGQPVVISDVRRTNEAEAIWDWGGSLVSISRNGAPEDRAMAEIMDAADYDIDNAAGLEDLGAAAAALASWLGVR